MSTNFPGSLDDSTSLPNPTAVSKTNNPSHASQHANENDAIKAIEAKVGTGATGPTANTLLRGTGAGTSAWGTITSAQLAAAISDETGSGGAVFANTPTLVTPAFDTANESTPGNGMTFDGLNIKDGKLNTNNSVVTLNITDGAVTPAKLQSGTGASWTWQPWTPVASTGGFGSSATASGKYIQIGKTVHFNLSIVVGTSANMGVIINLPVTAKDNTGYPIGQAIATDVSSSQAYNGTVRLGSTTTMTFAMFASGTNGRADGFSNAANPFAWAAADTLLAQGTYEAV